MQPDVVLHLYWHFLQSLRPVVYEPMLDLLDNSRSQCTQPYRKIREKIVLGNLHRIEGVVTLFNWSQKLPGHK